ncbi:phage major tail tube protein [Bradyrhizobium sp. USDA 4452]
MFATPTFSRTSPSGSTASARSAKRRTSSRPRSTSPWKSFRGGGMDGTVEIPFGIEKIEFDFTLHTWDEQIWTKLGYGPGSLDVPITFRGYLLTPGGGDKGVVITTLCLVKAIKTGKAEAGKKVEMTINVCANYYQHNIDGNVVAEIDVFNKVTMIGGVDKSANARRILGFTS